MKKTSAPAVAVFLLCAQPTSASVVPATGVVAGQLGDPFGEVSWAADGSLRFATGRFGWLAAGGQGARAFVRQRAAVLGLRDDETQRVVTDTVDGQGRRHVVMSRWVSGVPVELDRIRLHTTPNGDVRFIEAELSDLLGLRVDGPRIPPLRAVALARNGYAGELWHEPRPSLTVLGQRAGLSEPHLAFRVRIAYRRPAPRIPVVQDVFIDAQSGERLLALQRIYSQATATTMGSTNLEGATVQLNVTSFLQSVLMQDTATLPNGGKVLTADGSRNYVIYETPSTASPFADRAAVSAHDGVHTVLSYWQNEQQWSNWDFSVSPAAPGGLVLAVAHEGVDMPNAYWTVVDDEAGGVWGIMALGDGDGAYVTQTAACLDIIGHEMTHGVVDATAGLVYHLQSGAANEHFADVFGWMLDQGDDLIGESCLGSASASALRDICSPPNVQVAQPDHMRDYVTLPDTEAGDWGGVHFNSGILNRAACVARDAIGFDKVGSAWFRALRYHLGPTSDFAAVARATLTACSELPALTVGDCASIANAWEGVGLAVPLTSGVCPDNAEAIAGSCFCVQGFRVNAAGVACEQIGSIVCPPNSHPVGGTCYCDAGYEPDATGTSCQPIGSATCPSNSHREDGTCVCDECYAGNPATGITCQASPGCVTCDSPLEVASGGVCVCIPGITEMCGPRSNDYNVDQGGTVYYGRDCCQEGDPCGWSADSVCDCFGECGWDTGDCGTGNVGDAVCGGTIPGDCGNESWAGRCVGDTLIYCNTERIPSVIEYGDCARATEARMGCGFDTENGWYDCVTAVDPCGGVPATGQCASGSIGRYCDGISVREVPCDYGCGPYTYDGAAYEFCLPCPPHSELEGNNCQCDPGWEPDSSGWSCVESPCPLHSHRETVGCVCDPQYVPDASGAQCVGGTPAPPTAACPCDTTGACSEGCTCDPDCSGDSGCAATGGATGWQALLGLLALVGVGQRRHLG